MRMIKDALKPRDEKIPRGKVNQIQKKTTVEGGKACVYSMRSNVAKKTPKTLKFANNNLEGKRSLEGVMTCNQRLPIRERIFAYRRK